MKKNFTLIFATLLCLFWTKGSAQVQFWSDDFEAAGAPSSGTRTPEENGGTTSPSASYFKLTDGSTIQQIVPFTGKQGTSFWAGEDHNALGTGFTASGAVSNQTANATTNELQIEWTGINIAGKNGLSFKGFFAAASTNEPWDNTNSCGSGVGTTNTDYIIVEYSIDGGSYNSLIRFFNKGSATNGTDKYLYEDTDGNGCGDGIQLTNVFGEFSKNIAGTGTTLSIRIRVFSEGNNEEWGIDNFRLFAAPVNTAPTDVALSTTSVNENVAAASTVGTLTSTDANVGDTFTYTLVSGTGSTDNAAFSISGNNLTINASPNFETKSSYSIRVRTTDQGGLSFEKAFTVNINNLNETPTDISLSATAINENVGAASTVGTLTSTDPDAANTFTYTLVAGTGSTDNAAFSISGANLQIVASPNFETKSSYSVRIRTADQGGLSYEEAFTININNLNETPTDISLSATSINENVTAGSTVGTLSSVDVDAANTFTYTLVAGTGSTDNAAFSISGANLQIVASPNFETKSSYSVRIRTADQGGLSYEEAFTININNLNETPTDISLSATSINENVTAGSTVGTLSSVDVDAANTFTYTLVAGTGSTDNAAFSISGANLQIVASPDFETKSSYSIRVRTTDQGGLTFEKAFTITIIDVCELNNTVSLTSGVLTANQVGATYQWIQCPATVLSETGQSFTPTVNGSYSVTVTIGGCSVTSSCIPVTTLGTNDLEITPKLSIYPNPSQGIVTIQSDSAGDFQIINEVGQIVKKFKVEANIINTIDVQNLSNNVYFIKGTNSNDKAYKLLIQK